MDKKLDVVEMLEKTSGVKLLPYQKAYLKLIDKYGEKDRLKIISRRYNRLKPGIYKEELK